MDEYIRPPDNTIRECLLPSLEENDTEIDFELQIALADSIRMKEMEKEEQEERVKRFSRFRFKIKQFEQLDKLNAIFYEELINYIEMYERYNIQQVIVTDEFYAKLWKIANNMRLNTEEKQGLLEFIKTERR